MGPSEPVKHMYRMIWQAFARNAAASRAGDVLDILDHLTTVKFHCCKASTEAIYKSMKAAKKPRSHLVSVHELRHQQADAAKSGIKRRHLHPSALDNGTGITRHSCAFRAVD